jgi:CRP/FNR family transcriptional regulator, cyclic AMP receptor protein
MLPLRIVAICSNVLFATFGALAHIYPILVLHIILCPINVVRLFAVAKPMSLRRLRVPVTYARPSPE